MRQFVIQWVEDGIMFAIVTFRKAGPIKTWSAMHATNVHNARTKPLDHAVTGAPGPRHLIGTGDLVADVKRRLEIVRLDPDRLRRNGVIAYEAILTASAEFFEKGNEADRAARLAAWTKAQMNWADGRYGPLRIVSMVLHQDEKTPHIHLVVLPLEVKPDRRRTDREPRWSLVGRTISGPGRFDQVQDDYAAAMAPFGLIRGVRGSGRKHEPVPVYLARMAAKEQEVDEARIMVMSERTALSASRRAVAAKESDLDRAVRDQAAAAFRQEREEEDRRRRLDWDRDAMLITVAAERKKVAAERLALKQERIEHAERIAVLEEAIARDRDVLQQEMEAIHAMRDQIRRDADAARADAAVTTRAMQAAIELQQAAEQDRAEAKALRTHARTVADKIEAHRKQLLPTLAAAAEFRKKVAALGEGAITPVAAAVLTSASALRAAALSAQPPEAEVRPNVLAAYASIRDRAVSIGR